jgi:hypothetical protein
MLGKSDISSSLPTSPSGSGIQWLWWWSLLPEAEILIVLVVALFAFRKCGGAPIKTFDQLYYLNGC